MSTLQSRASAGNWIENRTLVRHAPDAVVLINGYEEFATCPSCNRTINLQKFITSIDCDATTELTASANFSVTIPQYELSRFMRDGVPILQPALEVVVFMRGYFPMKNFADLGQDSNPGFDANNVPVYPYYQVFRGVVTNVSHAYSGGFYTASVQCSNFLHFWQTQYISTNGAVFARRPKGSMVEPSLIGSKLTGMNPYEIVYTLVKATFGAAYGVEFKFSQTSNVSAEDDSASKNLFTHAAEWWAKNFSKQQGSLRMYGADGGLFNVSQQAFLGAWSSISSGRFDKILKRVYTALNADNTLRPITGSSDFLKKLKANLFNQISTVQSIASSKEGRAQTVDVLRMQAFILDIGKMGSVNLFESEYMTKSQIAQEVMNLCGYELYQDVDGDIVFKPPMYNMDTSSDPVYVIEDRDLISLTEAETEPEATMIKATGNHFANLAGHGVEGWMGVGAVFIDYRLVAKFGYKEETFESNYLSSRHALYISCVNRLDLANVGVKSATISIPLRPEMRAGYPIYIPSVDCFYYVKSISHSFAFNGQCTSTINCVAKRAKWFPPMSSTSGGELPSLSNVKLGSPGEYPSRPLMAYPQYLDPSNSEGPPQPVGFPNVILALDANKVNIDSIDIPRSILTPEAYVELALSKGILQRGALEGEYVLRSGQFRGETVTLENIQEGYANVDTALAAGTLDPKPTDAFGKILVEIEKIYNSIDSPDVKQLVNYLALQTSLKNYYAPGTGYIGRYRYFSCSHPNKEEQAPENLKLDPTIEDTRLGKTEPGPPDPNKNVVTFQDVGPGKGVRVVTKTPLWGVEIANVTNLGSTEEDSPKTIRVPSSDIRYVTTGPQYSRNIDRVSEVKEAWNEGTNFRLAQNQTTNAFTRLLRAAETHNLAGSLKERLSNEYDRILAEIDSFSTACGVSGDAQVSKAQSTAKKFFTTYKNEYAKTATQAYPKLSDDSAISKAVVKPGGVLWDYVSTVVARTIKIQEVQDGVNQTTQYGTERSDKYDYLMQERAKFIRAYTKGQLIVPDSAPARIYDTAEIDYLKNGTRYKVSWTPIFPVSDGAGYEVFGNLPYGRGVNIERYAGLLQVTRDVSSSVTDPAEAAAKGKTNIQNYGINASNMEAIEQFLVAWAVSDQDNILKPDAKAILQNTQLFSEADQASILAGLNTDLNSLQSVVEAIMKGETSEFAQIRNKPVTSFSRGQSFTSEAAAENLARLTYGDVGCSCRGSDAMFLVQALSEEFVDIFGEDPLVPWTQSQVYTPQTNTGEYTKKVLAGEYLDTRNTNLAEQFTQQGDVASSYAEAGANLAEGINNPTGGGQ